jgi:ABC-type transport system substrate-binding protein
LNDAKSQLPQAICELTPGSINRNLLINRDKPPFDNRDLRRAMALSLDRQAFIDCQKRFQSPQPQIEPYANLMVFSQREAGLNRE